MPTCDYPVNGPRETVAALARWTECGEDHFRTYRACVFGTGSKLLVTYPLYSVDV